MISIEIASFARFKDTFGAGRRIEILKDSNISAKDALLKLCEETAGGFDVLFDSDKELLESVLLMHNKKRISGEDADSIIIEDGDEIVIYPPVSGG
ncbi:MAG: MoaD/ThiS family protein [Methanomicrobiaceae archaeon]|nr:MoaD/ThiS family protein [Methanomicrobiaceae archaeon]